ncbi:hypothetical protein L9F63_019126, partial [Diploptera punctata]
IALHINYTSTFILIELPRQLLFLFCIIFIIDLFSLIVCPQYNFIFFCLSILLHSIFPSIFFLIASNAQRSGNKLNIITSRIFDCAQLNLIPWPSQSFTRTCPGNLTYILANL